MTSLMQHSLSLYSSARRGDIIPMPRLSPHKQQQSNAAAPAELVNLTKMRLLWKIVAEVRMYQGSKYKLSKDDDLGTYTYANFLSGVC